MLRESVQVPVASSDAHTHAVAQDAVVARPSIYIAENAKKRHWELISIVVPYWIQFPYVTYKQWEDCKDPRCYNLPNNTNDSDFIILLELLIFIAQRSLLDLAKEGVLETFVDTVRGHLDDDNRFVGLTDYQFLLSPFHFSPEKVNTIKDVVAVAVRNAC